MVTFDGRRITYIGDMGAFWLYPDEDVEKQLSRAVRGCATLQAAEEALHECEVYLQLFGGEAYATV